MKGSCLPEEEKTKIVIISGEKTRNYVFSTRNTENTHFLCIFASKRRRQLLFVLSPRNKYKMKRRNFAYFRLA